ncbi:hypothetical protein X801_00090, partial [Opisthorchis viverrini]
QRRAKIVDNRRQTSDQAVQTVAQKPEGDFIRVEKPLIHGFEHKTQCIDEKFSLALIDIAFHMHEQLSCYQASRTAENRKHEAFVCELKKNYEKNLQALRRKYRVDLESFRKRIEETAERHTTKLREEGKDLRRRLLEAEAQQAEANHTIRRLQLQLSSLGSNTGKRSDKEVLSMDSITVFRDVFFQKSLCEIRQDSRTHGTGTRAVPRKPHNKYWWRQRIRYFKCKIRIGSNGHIDMTHQEYDAFPYKGQPPFCP